MLATADTGQTGADGWRGGNTLAARYHPDRVNSIDSLMITIRIQIMLDFGGQRKRFVRQGGNCGVRGHPHEALIANENDSY
jgi:hypothetical protein